MLPRIVEILNKLTPQVTYSAYFEFLAEFVKYYAVVLREFILSILGTVINRILSEQITISHSPSEQLPGVIINKCWNVIRIICERHEYMPLLND